VLLREALLAARREAQITQEQLAAQLERPQSFIAKYETGDRRLDVVEFIDVCRALGVDPKVLLGKIEGHLT